MSRNIKVVPPTPSSKEVRYRQLVDQRKQCHLCRGLTNPQHWKEFDSAEIGPWSRWQANLNADLMVIGQDFSDVDTFARQKGLDSWDNDTNTNLVELLVSVGIQIQQNSLKGGKGEIFLTNAILCLKPGKGMQAPVMDEWFDNCGHSFLKAQIDLVNPKVLVCLGQKTYDAVAILYGLPKAPTPYLNLVEQQTGAFLPSLRTRLIGLYHCGARSVNRNRNMVDQHKDWRIVKTLLRN